ncbi:hypothetical protein GCM10025862_16530 [Arsenicicoccus piscis]|uniref:Glycine cleavage system P-protein N-terminal domain-containing protein n=1 Tax=Arsenicicoccus piscis TaxID=673954 RepID=A0ABQ6HMT8_9MICO|nr:hypothetical protein GCM10025862_16530 [Arsenicicoccus piscis]
MRVPSYVRSSPVLDPSPLPEFVGRHIGPSDADVEHMLSVVGQPSIESLLASAAPAAIRSVEPLDIEPAASEQAVVEELRAIAAKNQLLTSMIGQGYYGTVVPPVVKRKLLENPAWYTAYTPYQPEISQGRLEALLNYQTMVNDLTGLDIANSSLLDESTAAAEAMTLMRRSSKVAKDAVLLVDEQVFTQTIAVVSTRAVPLGLEVVVADLTQVRDADSSRLRPGDGRCSACWCSTQAPTAGWSTGRPSPRRRTRPGRSSPPPPTCSRSPSSRRRGSGARISPSAPASASACPWVSAARTPASCPCGGGLSGPCPVGSSG